MKSRASWIYYPSDFETMLMNRLNMRRRDRELIMPPIWHMHEVYHCVKFARVFHLSGRDRIKIIADGEFNVELDTPGNYLHDSDGEIILEKGEHSLTVTVYNESGLPCLYVEGEQICTDGSWHCTAFDGQWLHAQESGFSDPKKSPNRFRLRTKRIGYVNKTEKNGGVLYDFGKETFACLLFRKPEGRGKLRIYYGESEKEALDTEHCETLDVVRVGSGTAVRTPDARGFRYAFVVADGVRYDSVEGIYEYAKLYDKAYFRCSDELLARIWDVSQYTMQLTTREFFIDGIKRDRWVWMGDAAQSILMNWYCFYDCEIARRTLTAMAGKGAVTQYMNTINDYTLYWFGSVESYYRHTGDLAFVRRIYPRILAHIGFCVSRLNEAGMMEGREGDWVFVDWYDGLTKDGALCFIQLLLWKAYRTVATLSEMVGEYAEAETYTLRARKLSEEIDRRFWDEEAGAFVWSESDRRIFRQPNVMAVLTGFAGEKQRGCIRSLLHSESVPPILTPYMRFYELSALAELGGAEEIVGEIRRYWGGMLSHGATTFWERFDPSEGEEECLSMYGRRYGKSLCHAWGASPLYLIGKYLLGLDTGLTCGKSFVLQPAFALLGDFSVRLPVPGGELVVDCENGCVRVESTGIGGELRLPGGVTYEVCPGRAILVDCR